MLSAEWRAIKSHHTARYAAPAMVDTNSDHHVLFPSAVAGNANSTVVNAIVLAGKICSLQK